VGDRQLFFGLAAADYSSRREEGSGRRRVGHQRRHHEHLHITADPAGIVGAGNESEQQTQGGRQYEAGGVAGAKPGPQLLAGLLESNLIEARQYLLKVTDRAISAATLPSSVCSEITRNKGSWATSVATMTSDSVTRAPGWGAASSRVVISAILRAATYTTKASSSPSRLAKCRWITARV
jgi:hypothetical protein